MTCHSISSSSFSFLYFISRHDIIFISLIFIFISLSSLLSASFFAFIFFIYFFHCFSFLAAIIAEKLHFHFLFRCFLRCHIPPFHAIFSRFFCFFFRLSAAAALCFSLLFIMPDFLRHYFFISSSDSRYSFSFF